MSGTYSNKSKLLLDQTEIVLEDWNTTYQCCIKKMFIDI